MPADALRSPRAARPLAGAIAAWAESWFAAGGWEAADAFEPAGTSEWPLLRQEQRFALHAKPKAMIELAFALLGAKPRPDLTEADLRLLRRFSSRAIDDLVVRIDAALPRPAASEPARPAQWQLSLGPPARPWLSILVDEPMLTVMARDGYGPARRPSPLVRARAATDDVYVSLSSRIGSARLRIEQLDALEVGDLVLLDESARMPAQLIVADRASDLRVAIGEADERLTLTMQE